MQLCYDIYILFSYYQMKTCRITRHRFIPFACEHRSEYTLFTLHQRSWCLCRSRIPGQLINWLTPHFCFILYTCRNDGWEEADEGVITSEELPKRSLVGQHCDCLLFLNMPLVSTSIVPGNLIRLFPSRDARSSWSSKPDPRIRRDVAFICALW